MLTLLALIAAIAVADPADGLLVQPEDLRNAAVDNTLVVLQVGTRGGYDAGHIPGAVHVELADLAVTGPAPGNLILEMPDVETLRQRLESLGVSDDSRIVVVAGDAPLQSATRVLFTLDAAGLGDRSSLLDGGLAAWTEAGLALSTEAVSPAPGRLSALELRDLIVDADEVLAARQSSGAVIIDGRDAVFYTGERAGRGADGPQPAGHIAGAVSIPYSQITNEDGTVKSEAELAEAFRAAGVEPGERVIAYCHVGQQATAVIFAARLIGAEAVLYDGSFQDWSQRGLPVEASE